jgi:hypothetical protein
MVEHDPQVVKEILLKPRDFRSIGDFPEAAELSKFPRVSQKYEKQAVSRD